MLNMNSRKREDRDESDDDDFRNRHHRETKAKVKIVAPMKIIMAQGKEACIEYFRQLSDDMKVQAIQHWTQEGGIDDKLWDSMKLFVQKELADHRNFLGDQFDLTIDSLQYYGVPFEVTEMAKQSLLTCNIYQYELNYFLNAFVLSAFLAKAKMLCNEFYLYKLNLADQIKYAYSWHEKGIQDDLWSIMRESVTSDLLKAMPAFKDNIYIVTSTLNQARASAPNETVKFEQSRAHQIRPMRISKSH